VAAALRLNVREVEAPPPLTTFKNVPAEPRLSRVSDLSESGGGVAEQQKSDIQFKIQRIWDLETPASFIITSDVTAEVPEDDLTTA